MRHAIAIGLAAVVAVVGAAAMPAAAEPAKIRFTFASTFPSTMPLIGAGAGRLAEKIARATGGEIELQLHEPGKLVPAARTMHAVSDGTVDAGWGGAGWFASVDSAFNMFSTVPFGPGIGEYMAWMYHGGGLEFAREMPEIIAALEGAWNEVAAEEAQRNPNFRRIYDSYAAFRREYALWSDHVYLK